MLAGEARPEPRAGSWGHFKVASKKGGVDGGAAVLWLYVAESVGAAGQHLGMRGHDGSRQHAYGYVYYKAAEVTESIP